MRSLWKDGLPRGRNPVQWEELPQDLFPLQWVGRTPRGLLAPQGAWGGGLSFHRISIQSMILTVGRHTWNLCEILTVGTVIPWALSLATYQLKGSSTGLKVRTSRLGPALCDICKVWLGRGRKLAVAWSQTRFGVLCGPGQLSLKPAVTSLP